METMDKHAAMEYILSNNPVCTDCARGNPGQVRMAAGLYQLLKNIASSRIETFTAEELNRFIKTATEF